MEKEKTNIWLKSLLIVYIVLLTWIILFKLEFSIPSPYKIVHIHLVPFYYENSYFPLMGTFLNVLIFMPLGLYLKMLKIDNKAIIISGFAVSLIFELSQYILKIGLCDITDLITNTTGAILGLYLYVLFCKIFKNNDRLDRIIKIIATIITVIMIIFFLLALINCTV